MQADEHRDRRRLHPLAGVLAVFVLVVAAAWAADFIPGDVNNDGMFDIADPTVLRRELAGLGPGISQEVLCGNGVLDSGEECDSGVICSDLGFAFGELVCGAGCVADVDTCTNNRFEDLGLTVFDHQTGLEWEKKTGSVVSTAICDFFPDSGGTCADLSNVNNLYDWNEATGEWLSRLNGLTNDSSGASQSGFAGHTDWRFPSQAELLTIFDGDIPSCGPVPCIDPVFGPTGATFTWSSSSRASPPDDAWGVNFQGGVTVNPKSSNLFVRAVRSGPPPCGDGTCGPAEDCSACEPDCELCSICDQAGVYVSTPIVGQRCAFDIVRFNVRNWTIADLGAGTISIDNDGGHFGTMTGTSGGCPSGSFVANVTVPGPCQQTYSLSGAFTGPNNWSGTFSAAHTENPSGSCLDCSDFSVTVQGMR